MQGTSAFALSNAATWLQATLHGPIATSIAIIAVAAAGVSMFTGQMHWRRGAATIIGCFVLFGAPMIASGIMNASDSSERPFVEPYQVTTGSLAEPASTYGRPQSICWNCNNPNSIHSTDGVVAQ